jgi:hypothetical protein
MMRESWPTPVTTDWVYWSQSLWLISRVENGSTTHTMADKNLWASVVWNEWDTFSATNCGDFYQRWNNYWFDYSWPSTTSNTPVDPTGYWPWNYYSSSTFITNPNYPYSWWSTFNANLRWDTTNTIEARQWPCPSWFHVPASAELSWCISIFGSASGHWKSILDVFKMPPCWNINYDGTLYHPTVYPMAAYYRTSSKYVTSQAWLVYINYNNNSSPDTQWTNRCDAYPIRPFKNTVVQPDSTRTALFQPA